MWVTIPIDPKVDILVSHGPPLGHGDKCSSGMFAGCADLLDWVEQYAPPFHIFGHVHEGYGVTTNGRTTFINASSLDALYNKKAMHAPIVFDFVLKE